MLLFLRYSCGSIAVSLKALMRLASMKGLWFNSQAISVCGTCLQIFACLSHIFPPYKGFIFSPDTLTVFLFSLFLNQFRCFVACPCQSTGVVRSLSSKTHASVTRWFDSIIADVVLWNLGTVGKAFSLFNKVASNFS